MFNRLFFLTITIFSLAVNFSLGAIIDKGVLSLEQTQAHQVLRDQQGLMTLEEVRQSSHWKTILHREDTQPGYDHSAFWLRFSLSSSSPSQQQWPITLESTRWEEIDWYIIRENDQIEQHLAGNARPGPPGMMHGFRPNILLDLAPGEEVDIYLRCRSLARGSLNVQISNLQDQPQHSSDSTYLLTFGALATLCAIAILLAFRGQQKGGIPYALGGISLTLVYVGLSGFAKSSDLPFSHFLAMRGGNFFTELSLLTSLFYLRAFFDLEQTRQWPHYAWRTLLIISLIALPLSLVVPFHPFIRIVNAHGAIHGFVSVFIAVWAWRQGMNFAKYYVFVWPFLWVALLFDFFAGEGILPIAISQDHIVAICLVVFQFGIFLVFAERTRAKIREHEALQDKLLEKEKDLNLSLERQVEARTASLQQATEEAVKANSFKDLFLANMGHEIRTPLSALIGLSQIMVRKGEAQNLPPDFRRMLGQIHSGGSHLNLMLTNLMDVGTTSHGRVPLCITSVDLSAWSQSVRDILEPLAISRGLTLQWNENFSNSTAFTTDQIRLSQILINLVHNALKFSPEDGVVEVFLTKKDSLLTLEILDQGCGLPENPEILFNIYERHEATLSDAEHGAGLGLHIVKTTLELLGGEIIATNRPLPHQGASFHVTISQTTSQP